MKKLIFGAALALCLPFAASAAEYQCADGSILSTGTLIEKSHTSPTTGELITTTSVVEGQTPFVYWQRAECRFDTAKNLEDAFAYAEIVEAYVSKWGIWTLEELFPERFGK